LFEEMLRQYKIPKGKTYKKQTKNTNEELLLEQSSVFFSAVYSVCISVFLFLNFLIGRRKEMKQKMNF